MGEIKKLAQEIRSGDRIAVSRAITLVESSRSDHRVQAKELLTELNSETGKAIRVGISGVPGVGKSTFIEALGMYLVGLGHKVGVLAVDPSSVRTGGSVLGDKTRMAQLSNEPNAYIRPSPSAGTLGGVARTTAEAIVILEAAGFDVVLVETVGVGQSEITVSRMVDTFVFLTLARTGDQLQGIKKGILEIADVIAVNKADDDREGEARVTARELSGALRMVHGDSSMWIPKVLTCSALNNINIDDVWGNVLEHRQYLGDEGLRQKRAAQQWEFTQTLVRDELDQRLEQSLAVQKIKGQIEREVLSGELPASIAADRILEAFDS